MCDPGDEWWPEEPRLPELVVDYTPPVCLGQILGPDGEPLVDVYEHREPFGYQRR